MLQSPQTFSSTKRLQSGVVSTKVTQEAKLAKSAHKTLLTSPYTKTGNGSALAARTKLETPKAKAHQTLTAGKTQYTT